MDYRNQGDDIGIQNPTLGYNPPPGRGSAFSRPTFSTSTSLLSPRAAAGGVGVGVAGFGANRNGHIIANITPILPQPLPTAAAAAAATAATKISHSIDISTSIDDHSSSSQSFGSQIPDPAAPISNSSQSPAAGAGGILSYSNPPAVTPLTKAFTTANAAAADVSCRYRECLRNHAASVGGHVVDGCGEFMPNGDPSMPEYLKCAACGCHRSFHRKEHEVGESNGAVGISKSYHRGPARLPLLLPPPHPQSPHAPKHFHFGGSGGGVFPPSPSSRPAAPAGSSVVMAFGSNTSGSGGTTTESSSEERLHHTGAFPTLASAGSRKRFRTKFTPEQKEKMLAFAEQIGWRFQKKDEAAVEQFCAEAGVRRQVLKVWMHNNKHTNKKHEQKPLEHDELLPQHHQQQ